MKRRIDINTGQPCDQNCLRLRGLETGGEIQLPQDNDPKLTVELQQNGLHQNVLLYKNGPVKVQTFGD